MNQNIRAGPGTENLQHQNCPKYKKQKRNNDPQINEQNKNMILEKTRCEQQSLDQLGTNLISLKNMTVLET